MYTPPKIVMDGIATARFFIELPLAVARGSSKLCSRRLFNNAPSFTAFFAVFFHKLSRDRGNRIFKYLQFCCTRHVYLTTCVDELLLIFPILGFYGITSPLDGIVPGLGQQLTSGVIIARPSALVGNNKPTVILPSGFSDIFLHLI